MAPWQARGHDRLKRGSPKRAPRRRGARLLLASLVGAALAAPLAPTPLGALEWRRDALCDPERPPSPQGGLLCLPGNADRRQAAAAAAALNQPSVPHAAEAPERGQAPALPLGTMPDGARLLLTGPRPRPAIERLERDLQRGTERPRLIEDVGLGLRLTAPLYPGPGRRAGSD